MNWRKEDKDKIMNIFSSLEEALRGNNFIRIHRSFIVAINKIESFTNDTIEIARQELPISRMYRHEVEKLLNI